MPFRIFFLFETATADNNVDTVKYNDNIKYAATGKSELMLFL